MKQNIYDDPEFFAGYKAMRDAQTGLNDILEQPAMHSLFPNVEGLRVLDLGCGEGQLCVVMRELGATLVVGIDISERMIEQAQAHASDGIEFYCTAVEDFKAEPEGFDLVVSSLMLHYVADLDAIIQKVSSWLVPGGHFVFSIEHPIATAAQGIHPGWARDARGQKLFWAVDSYQDEGRRKSTWIVDGVVKYHRTVSTVLNTLIDNGLCICRILEPHAIETAEKHRPDLKEERRRPPFLLVKAIKTEPT